MAISAASGAPLSSAPVCPKCGFRISRNGRDYCKVPPQQTYRCASKKCGYRFRSPKLKSPIDWDGLARAYFLDSTSLESLVRTSALPFSKSTLWNGIKRETSKAPSGIDFSERVKLSKIWRNVLNLDTSGLKFRGKQYSYLQFSDIPSGDQLDYGISDHEDRQTIVSHLGKIRYRLGYVPKLVVSDLAPELIEAVRAIYSDVPVQGCLFHLERLLNTRLPTWRLERVLRKGGVPLTRFMPPETADPPHPVKERALEPMKRWAEVKRKIMDIAHAKDQQAQQAAVAELRALDSAKDRKCRQVIDNFLNSLKFYHPRDELEELGISKEMWYSNRCENDIGRIKRLWSIHKGFKSLESARKYIDFFWWKTRASHIVSENLIFYLQAVS